MDHAPRLDLVDKLVQLLATLRRGAPELTYLTPPIQIVESILARTKPRTVSIYVSFLRPWTQQLIQDDCAAASFESRLRRWVESRREVDENPSVLSSRLSSLAWWLAAEGYRDSPERALVLSLGAEQRVPTSSLPNGTRPTSETTPPVQPERRVRFVQLLQNLRRGTPELKFSRPINEVAETLLAQGNPRTLSSCASLLGPWVQQVLTDDCDSSPFQDRLRRWVANREQAPGSPATLAARLTALAWWLACEGCRDAPQRAFALSLAAEQRARMPRPDRSTNTRQAHEPSERPQPSWKTTTLLRGDLDQILRSVRPGFPADLRDAALALLLHETGFRPKDILGEKWRGHWRVQPLQVDDLRVHDDGSGLLKIGDCEESAPGVAVSADCVRWLQAWTQAAGLQSGAMFRSPAFGDEFFDEAPPMQVGVALGHFQRLAARAGLEHLDLKLVSIRHGARAEANARTPGPPIESPSCQDPAACWSIACPAPPTEPGPNASGAPLSCTRRPTGYVGVARQARARRKLENLLQQVTASVPPLAGEPGQAVEWLMTSLSPLTMRNFQSAVRKWVQWLGNRTVDWGSVPTFIDAYVNDLVASGLAPRTLVGLIWALGCLWEACGLADHHVRIRLRKIHRQLRRPIRRTRTQATPCRRAHLQALLRAVRSDSPRDLCIGALCAVLHETLARAQDILGVKFSNEWIRRPVEVGSVRRMRDRSGRIRLASEGAADHVVAEVPLSPWAMQWIEAWLQASGITSGALFRAMPLGDTCLLASPPLQEKTARNYFARLVDAAGLSDHGFTLRSLRVGAANDLLQAGVHPESVRAAGRWSDLGSVAHQDAKPMIQRPAEELAAHFARTCRSVHPPTSKGKRQVQQLGLPF
jgi:integrase